MKKRIAALLLLVCVATLSACGPRSPLSKNGFLLDTVITITLYDSQSQRILDDAFTLCEKYDAMFSRTDPDSEVYALNHSSGKAMPMSPESIEVIETAIYYSGLTDGKYDITICPVTDLWNFKADFPALPDPDALQQALTTVDYRNIVVDGNTVRLDNGAMIDLGSIAKGYIADRLADFLQSRGVNSAIINLGGNIMTVGEKAPGKPFSIGIQKPFEQRNETIGAVAINGKSVVSSGVYERYFLLDDMLYHHILDVRTGYPVDLGLSSVTILSDKSVDGDALSTCCFVLGLTEGMALVESLNGVEAVFISDDGAEYFSSGFGITVDYRAN